MTSDQNGNRITKSIRRESDGTWSRNVWCGAGSVTTVRRYSGYRTRRLAEVGDISETPAETNRRN